MQTICNRREKVPWAAVSRADLLALVIAVVATPASAASITYTLGAGNSGLACCTGPYATVTINQTSNINADVTFTSLTNGGYIYLMGDGGTADLNVAGTYTIGNVVETNSLGGFTPTYIGNSPGQVDGFGNFNLSLDNFDGFTGTATSISFTISSTSGGWGSTADSSDVLTNNASGFLAAIHAFACAEPGCSSASGAISTGFAANGGTTPPTPVPEPGTLALLGIGLLGLGFLGRGRLVNSTR